MKQGSYTKADESGEEAQKRNHTNKQQLYFLTLNIQISHHLQIARLIKAGGVWTA